jgi:hypothetical protein
MKKLKVRTDFDPGCGNEFNGYSYPCDGLYVIERTNQLVSVGSNKTYCQSLNLPASAEMLIEEDAPPVEPPAPEGAVTEGALLKVIALLRSSSDVPANDILNANIP